MIYADGICLMASLPGQALINTLASILRCSASGDQFTKTNVFDIAVCVCTSCDLHMQWQPCWAGCNLQITGPSMQSVRLYCTLDDTNRGKYWCSWTAVHWYYSLLQCKCSITTNLQSLQGVLGACLTVRASGVGHAKAPMLPLLMMLLLH